ncbi:MAG TPA: STAS domain-containing protein [Vicinamibacterales bacterium]|jgi:anti-sigma B factor antagonist
MSLAIESRVIGDVAVLDCAGRIVEGDESAELETRVNALLLRHPYIVLDLRGVAFIDSLGLGLILRLRGFARAAAGDVKLSAPNQHIREVLRVTKLTGVLPPYESDSEAVAAFYSPAEAGDDRVSLEIDVLCVHPSADVLAYARELLKQAGYGVTTAANLSDARVLLHATTPPVLVIGPEWQQKLAALDDGELAVRVGVVPWPADFSKEDPGDAARQLLADVSKVLAGT